MSYFNLLSGIVLAAASVCCNCDHSRLSTPIDVALPIDSVAATLTGSMTVEEVAYTLVDWLGEAPIEYSSYGRSLAQSISRQYDEATQALFASYVDSIQHTLPQNKQLRALAVGSLPEALAHAIVTENIDSTIAPAIADIYSGDSTLHNRFVEALAKERSDRFMSSHNSQ